MIGRVLGGWRHNYDFYDVISVENLFVAWKKFRKGKRSKKDVSLFELNLENNIFKLHEDLLSGKWSPEPYIFFQVQDPKLRKIHKASVRDRVLYQAIYQKLYKIFDKSFIYDSYSSRDIKGTHRGVRRFNQFARKSTGNYNKNTFVLKCDVRKFFDSINHEILLKLIKKRCKDRCFLNLIEKIIHSFKFSKGKGLPLGNVTSQIFANIYLDELDQFIKHKLKAIYYIRYCDDFVIICPSLEVLKSYIIEIFNFLKNNLLLSLHPNKISIRKIIQGVDFLGYVSLPHYRVLRTTTKRRMFKKVSKTNLQSYFGILSHCRSFKIRNLVYKIFDI